MDNSESGVQLLMGVEDGSNRKYMCVRYRFNRVKVRIKIRSQWTIGLIYYFLVASNKRFKYDRRSLSYLIPVMCTINVRITNVFRTLDKKQLFVHYSLEVHSLTSHSSYTREFDVKTYIIDLVKYMLCSLYSLTF